MRIVSTKAKIISVVICVIGFFIPFFLKSQADSFNSLISTGFTIVQTLATIMALILAFLLFDKFGVNAKFKENQIEKVLELVYLLNDTRLTIYDGKFVYVNLLTLSWLKSFDKFPLYLSDKSKTILMSNAYSEFGQTIMSFLGHHWFPKELKQNISFVNIITLASVEQTNFEEYVQLGLSGNETTEWFLSLPQMTFEMYMINLHNFLNSLDVWIKKHSDIELDIALFAVKKTV